MKHHVPRAAPARGGPPGRPAAFTLVELLVAATLALVVMAALASLFGIFGRAVADSRELVQLGARMRSAAWRLRQDLQGTTTEVKPFIRPESANGYFEIVEGPLVDTGTIMLTGTTMPGDVDDILMLTTASPGRPFTGLLSGSTAGTTVCLESPVAEVAWFCKLAPPTADGLQLFNLYRRQLLVAPAPGVGAMATTNTIAFTSWDTFFLNNDLSARREGNTLIANSLADLTRRQSRFLHHVSGTANPAIKDIWPQISATTATLTGTSEILTSVREGEDLLLTNVIAFDVRVFDPAQSGGGGYVDLGGGTPGATSTQFAGSVNTYSGTGVPPTMRFSTSIGAKTATSWKVYDTWSLHTESNNVDDRVSGAGGSSSDGGSNWADEARSTANGVVDDVVEMELAVAPGSSTGRPSVIFNLPLRGVEIRIRCYEPASQEVRQITIQHSFLAR